MMEQTKMRNRIPRTFARIDCTVLTETSVDKPGDKLHIYKNDCGSGYLALNMRTGKYAYVFASMLRNPEIIQVDEIIK